MLMPAVAQLAFSAFIVLVITRCRLAYCRLKSSWALGDPGAAWFAAVPGLASQVSVPLGTTFHPWLVRRLLALVGLYG